MEDEQFYLFVHFSSDMPDFIINNRTIHPCSMINAVTINHFPGNNLGIHLERVEVDFNPIEVNKVFIVLACFDFKDKSVNKVPIIVGIEKTEEGVNKLLSKIKEGKQRPISKKYEYVFGHGNLINVTQEINFRRHH